VVGWARSLQQGNERQAFFCALRTLGLLGFGNIDPILIDRACLGGHNGPGQGNLKVRETMRTWMCLICGWVYDEEAGLPDEGIPPGTRWEDVPPNWVCPECGARKEDFELMEI
jgi:rubredoxin